MGASLRKFWKEVVGADPKKNPSVMPKPLGAEYAREDKQLGWRYLPEKAEPDPIPGQSAEDRKKQIEEFQRIRESDLDKTKYFNDAERQAAKVTFDEDGKAVGMQTDNDDGTVSGEVVGPLYGKKDYVVDPETGAFYQATPKKKIVGQVEAPFSGKNPVKKEQVMVKGEMTDQLQICHHSSILAGKPVAGAGEVKFDAQGNIVLINNSSGHYKPGAAQMIGTVEILIKAGALLDHTYTDAEGKALEGKAKDLYDAAMKVQAKLVSKLRNGEKVDADQKLIDKAKEALKKMGCAPRERFVENEQKPVAFADINDKMGGQKVKDVLKEADDNPVTAYDFLSTGAGNEKQAEQKEKMHEELKTRLKDEAQKLNKEAADRTKKLKTAEDELEELQQKLRKLPFKPNDAKVKAEREALEKDIEKQKQIIAKREDVKLDEVAKITADLGKRLKELSGVGGAEVEKVSIPPTPSNWDDDSIRYIEDTNPNAKDQTNLKEWAAANDIAGELPEVWVTYHEMLAAKHKMLAAKEKAKGADA
jgi:hypothetical protein